MTEVAELVRRTARGLGARGVRHVEVLARRADANVVVALTTVPDGRRVVAKARAGVAGCDGTRAAAALRAVGAALPPDGPLAVPTVLLHDPARGLLVTDHAPGRPLDERVAQGDLGAVRRAGAALAALHALPAVVGPTVHLADCLADLVRPHPRVLGAGLGDLSGRVSELLAAVLAAEPAPGTARPLHRDVHLRQLLDAGDAGRTWLLDWDLAAQGDPALDVGNLVASLRSKAVGEPVVQALLDGYAGGDRTGALGRRPVFEAFTYLRLACKRYRLDGPAARPQVVALLAAAERALEDCAAGRERVRA